MRRKRMIAGVIGLVFVGLVGCQLFEHDKQKTLTMPAMSDMQPENFIIGDPEIMDWGGHYLKNDAFFAINVPVVGAMKITYSITTGSTFMLFVETSAATKMEIGLQTVNGVVDVVDSVCVTYAENVMAFARVPSGIVKVTQHNATHYQRADRDDETQNWWPSDAAFSFGVLDTQLKTVCVVTNGVLGVTEISETFPKTTPSTVQAKDEDGDGVADTSDNCPAAANADQTDADGDGKGDACDNCPATANADQKDTDSDAQGDVCDPDDDNDTLLDGVDNCPLVANADQNDMNSNGSGDACDAACVYEPTNACRVKNTNDIGTGSLRGVLELGATCPTITFACSGTTITLETGQLTLANSVKIDGGSGVTISGNNISRVFYVNSGVNASFDKLTITEGRVGTGPTCPDNCGGGIYNDNGAITVNGTVSRNTAGAGGGIYNGYGNATVSGIVSANAATYGGGGIYNYHGNINVSATVSANTAGINGGGLNNNYGTTMVSGEVSNNRANDGGGGIYIFYGKVTISGTISENTAAGLYGGGGIYNDANGDASTLELLTSAKITSNHANNGRGGGIYSRDIAPGIATVTGANTSTVFSNTASSCPDYWYNAGCVTLPLP